VAYKIEKAAVSDPLCVSDVFVEGVAELKTLANNCVRCTLYATREDGERIVVARLVWPAMQIAVMANNQARLFYESGVLFG
jgi:hypothetical protein